MLVVNILCCFCSLAFIGFSPFLHSIVATALAYSSFLTLREWVVVIYILTTGAAALHVLKDTMELYESSTYMKLGSIALCVLWGYFAYNTTRLYIVFRRSGGIYGNNHSDYLFTGAVKIGEIAE